MRVELMTGRHRLFTIRSGVLFLWFFIGFTGLTQAEEQHTLQGDKEILAIGSRIIEDMDAQNLSGNLKTDIWLYESPWAAEPAKEGRMNLVKSGSFMGKVEKGCKAKIVGFKRLVGDYRPSRDVILKDHRVDFLRIEVLTGKKAGETGWFRKGTENLMKFSVNDSER